MAKHIQKLLAVGGVNGEVEVLEALLAGLRDDAVDAVTVVGDLGAPWSKADTYRAIFKTLGQSELTAFWVPGRNDAPLGDYLRESYNMEIAYPKLRSVHATAVVGPDHVLFAGIGGDIADDPEVVRSEEALIRYPGWEAEYRLKVLDEFKDYPKVFLFTTRPQHKGLGEEGSEVLAELINTYRPRLVVTAGDEPAEERLGTSLLVAPGRLDRASYALIDFHSSAVEFGTVATHAAVGN
jgi:Icc-related predicted phosphoesterase